MSEDVNLKMKDRKKILENEFNKLTDEANVLIEQGKTINKRLSDISARKLQIQGSFSELSTLLGEEPIESPVEETKKEKPKK